MSEKYWEQPFDSKESIVRVLSFEGTKLEAQVKCGLELWRAKLNISHTGFLAYLHKCGISQPTSSRRKKLAKLFLEWAGILGQNEKVNEHHITQGLNLLQDKPFKMNDFQRYVFELNKDSIYDSLQETAGGTPSQHISSMRALLGFDMSKVLKGLNAVDKAYSSWSD
jgi:hypothetical protein